MQFINTIKRYHFSKLLSLLLCLYLHSNSQIDPPLEVGDSLYTFFWAQFPEDSKNRGYYGLLSVNSLKQDTNLTTYQADLQLKGYPRFRKLIANDAYTISLVFFNRKPDSVEQCSNRFNNACWLRSISNLSDTDYKIRFYFPVLPITQSYTLFDYFSVIVNDTMCVQFQVISDTTIIGSFINRKNTGDGKTKIYAKDALAIQTTNKNSLRVKSIQIKGVYEKLVSGYLGFDLSKLKSDAAYYGINLIDTTISIQPVLAKNIRFSSIPPLQANVTDTILWSYSLSSRVQRCSLYVSVDSCVTWTSAGSTLGTDTNFIWTTPPKQADHCFIKARVIDTDGWKNDSYSEKFSIISPNSFKLTASSYKSNSVILAWNPYQISVPKAKSLCIAYRKDIPITDSTNLGNDTVMHNLSISKDTIAGLQTGAVYYFSAFVLDSLGVFHTPGGIYIDSALVQDMTPPENTYILRGSVLNSTSIALQWNPGTNSDTTIDSIGIRYSTLNFPVSIRDTLSSLVGIYTTSDTTDTVTGLAPDQGYYFSLFVGNSRGIWSNATQESKLYLRTDLMGGQLVILGTDTQHIMNDSILLWTIPKLQTNYVDTVYSWGGPPQKKGFVQTSRGFLFRKGTLPLNTTLCMKITHRSIPSPLKPTDQRLYRYNIYTGGWRVSTELIVFDTIKHTVTTTSNDASLPFIVMIDTLDPIVETRLNAQQTFSVTQRIIDTFSISDNIENPQISMFAGAGKSDYSDISLYISPEQQSTRYLTTIPPFLADEISGLRGLFLVDDKRNADTTNLSRKILRSDGNCDDTLASAMQWTPIIATATPENPSILAAISATGQPQPYNKKTERIMQWLPIAGNSSEITQWVEYSTSHDSLFHISPGKLFWLKSKNDRMIRFGKAEIPSLEDTFTVSLNTTGWTDFSIPYRFDLYLGDILEATEKSIGPAIDSIGIYKWVKSGASYRTEAIFLPGIRGVGEPDDTVTGAAAYSAYNSTAHPIPLKSPSNTIALKTTSRCNSGAPFFRQHTSSWSIKICVLQNTIEPVASIYCASQNDGFPSHYPLAPSFSTIQAGVLDNNTNKINGHAATGNLTQGGAMFDIVCENNASEKTPVTLCIDKKAGLPPDMLAGLYAIGSEQTTVGDTLRISVSPDKKSCACLLVGTAQYIHTIQQLLSSKFSMRVFSLPCLHAIRIVYTLPYATHTVTFTMFDVKGRSIISKKLSSLPAHVTSGHFSFSGNFASGLYIIEMSAAVKNRKNPHLKRQRVIYVK